MKYCTRILFFFLLGSSVALADTAATENAHKGMQLATLPENNRIITPHMQSFSHLCELIVKRTNNEMKSSSDYEDIQEVINACYNDSYRKKNPAAADALLGFALLRFVLIMMHEMNTLVTAIPTQDMLKIEDPNNAEEGMWQLYEQRIHFVNAILNKNMLPLLNSFNPTLLIDAQQKNEALVLVKLLKKESHDLFGNIKKKLAFVKNSLGKESALYNKISNPAKTFYYKLHPKPE